MEANQMFDNRAYPTILPCDTWDQYEQLRLERIQQQRKRMENMKDVVGQYSRIITDLERENKSLNRKLTQKNRSEDENHDLLLKNQELLANNKWMKAELERERKMKESNEKTIEQLREQILLLKAKDRDFEVNEAYQEALINRDRDYETLVSLYAQLKDQLYAIQRQNFELKNVIQHQSKLYYEKPENLQKFIPEKTELSNQNTKSQTASVPPIGLTSSKRQNSKAQSGDIDKYRRKIRQLKKQLKQQEELITKFKQTEEQQMELIDCLKNQKSKICLCHAHGTSSKKIMTSNKLSGFKIESLSKENIQSHRK